VLARQYGSSGVATDSADFFDQFGVFCLAPPSSRFARLDEFCNIGAANIASGVACARAISGNLSDYSAIPRASAANGRSAPHSS
jgi:hypothetical protein